MRVYMPGFDSNNAITCLWGIHAHFGNPRRNVATVRSGGDAQPNLRLNTRLSLEIHFMLEKARECSKAAE